MTQVLPEHPPRHRRWPWSHRTSRASDVLAAITLFVAEAVFFAWSTFTSGMEGWAAQGDRGRIDAATLANIAWMEHFLYALLALAALAALSRAPWTTVSHLVTAGLVFTLLIGMQHEWDRGHPTPAPTPRAGYSPCYSGSGTCN
ncbi:MULTISPECIES: DUF6234 family protein [unclassified Streptomyces]|jgi:hypothetical protein|uniref:DUF6234 family protein n=1 Tax=unclassified Streptomyces TaxID=2593676 RepID=UPI002E28AA1A|nr:DUF6234 family protein [Streptomyces sp. NBC_00252]